MTKYDLLLPVFPLLGLCLPTQIPFLDLGPPKVTELVRIPITNSAEVAPKMEKLVLPPQEPVLRLEADIQAVREEAAAQALHTEEVWVLLQTYCDGELR